MAVNDKKVIVFMADGMEMCECLLTVDILRRAGVNVTTASVTGNCEVLSSHQVRITADTLAEDADYDTADMIVLPGGRIGTENLLANETVRRECVAFVREKYAAAICAAPSVFAGLGLLEGIPATCHPDFEGKMRGAALTHEPVTVSGRIITGRGLGATMDFALCLATILTNKETADRIAASICYAR